MRRREEPRIARRALQPLDHRGGISGDKRWIVGIALIGAAPAHIARNRHGRREHPVHAGGRSLLRGRLADTPEEIGIVRGAQADIMRKYRGAANLPVAMHRVDTEQDRYRRMRCGGSRQGGLLVGGDQAPATLPARHADCR